MKKCCVATIIICCVAAVALGITIFFLFPRIPEIRNERAGLQEGETFTITGFPDPQFRLPVNVTMSLDNDNYYDIDVEPATLVQGFYFSPSLNRSVLLGEGSRPFLRIPSLTKNFFFSARAVFNYNASGSPAYAEMLNACATARAVDIEVRVNLELSVLAFRNVAIPISALARIAC